MKLVAALNKVYRIEGQTLTDFAAEVKQLTPEDRADFRAWFEAEGWTIDPE
jgi:hypothetical protein